MPQGACSGRVMLICPLDIDGETVSRAPDLRGLKVEVRAAAWFCRQPQPRDWLRPHRAGVCVGGQ